MTSNLQIGRFTRRVRLAIFAGALATAVGVLCATAAGALLVGRLLVLWPTPSPWWAAALLAPVAWAAFRVRAAGFGQRRAAVHVDRRLGLEGLLITGLERDTSAWQDRIGERLAAAETALPRLRSGRLLARAGLPAAALGALLLLPPPETPPGGVSDLPIDEAVADLQEHIELLQEEEVVSDDRAQELQARLDKLRDDAAGGTPIEWSDVDAVRDELGHENAQRAAALEQSRSALAELQAGTEPGGGLDAAEAGEKMARIAQAASHAGLLDKLDPALAARLGAKPGTGEIDPSALPTSLAGTAALAGELQTALEGNLAELEKAGLLDPAALADLADLGELVDGTGMKLTEVGHQHGPG